MGPSLRTQQRHGSRRNAGTLIGPPAPPANGCDLAQTGLGRGVAEAGVVQMLFDDMEEDTDAPLKFDATLTAYVTDEVGHETGIELWNVTPMSLTLFPVMDLVAVGAGPGLVFNRAGVGVITSFLTINTRQNILG
ncbi:hypothetical protein BU17DRAFT_88791 [Hysterangium stoloniferum]|nr:hypothetical protein BU17DRAFT_88791 [Hysterangium stoloniferum]